MKRNPRDPEGQYAIQDKTFSEDFCASEGYVGQINQLTNEPMDVEYHGYGVSITGEYQKKKSITDEVVEIIRERERVGYRNYKKPLMGDDKTLVEWLTDAIEECADQLQYLVAARDVIKKELQP